MTLFRIRPIRITWLAELFVRNFLKYHRPVGSISGQADIFYKTVVFSPEIFKIVLSKYLLCDTMVMEILYKMNIAA